MYSLFELAKIITFQQPEQSKSKSTVQILHQAWKEVGERSILALLFSNGYLLLRHGGHRRPTVRQLPWYPDRLISDMTFDPSGTWLLTVTGKGNLYIVPALALLEPSVQSSSQKWRTDDVSRIKPNKKRGVYTCVAWWQTRDGEDVAVVGTKTGYIEIVEMSNGNVAVEIDINEHVDLIDIVQDDSHSNTYALVTTKSKIQWKLLLEAKPPQAERQWSRDAEVEDMGFEKLDVSKLRNNIMYPIEDSASDFLPSKFDEFNMTVSLTPQYARGRHFVAAHDKSKNLYKIHDSTVERSPLFEYNVPENADNILLTDKLLFVTTTKENPSMKVLANQLTEVSEDRNKFSKDSILQEFSFSPDEKVMALYKRPYPFFWHEKYGDEQSLQEPESPEGIHMAKRSPKLSSQCQLNSHSVLDGCMVLTNHALYKCRPRVSPERLFMEYILDKADQTSADKLAIVCGLDINNLYQIAANLKLDTGDVQQATRFFQQSKCSHRTRIAAFAQHGHVAEVMTYLGSTLESTELSSADKQHMSDLMLHCYMHQLICSKDKQMYTQFKDFLLKNNYYDESVAMRLLANHGVWQLLIDVAKARGLLGDALEIMTSCGQKEFTEGPLSAFPVDILPTDKIVHSMSATDLAAACCSRPSSALKFMKSLRNCLADLDQESLLKVIQTFDPSTPQVQALLHRAKHTGLKKRSNSNSSLMTSFSSDTSEPPTESKKEALNIVEIMQFFIRAVLLFNSRRGFPKMETDFLLSEDEKHTEKENDSKLDSSKLQLSTRHRYVGCGFAHGAAVCDGDIYVWGKSSKTRMDPSDLKDKVVWEPRLVDSLHIKGIEVQYVTCGAEHTMALSHSGIYGWGSNRYGQVGATGADMYKRPVEVDALNAEMCIAVTCGQYHTGALTHDGRVFTWGWGVHGQLGHGNSQNAVTPSEMTSLNDVIRIKAGYAHTLLLTAEGEVYAVGCGVLGQLGQGDINKSLSPKKVQDLMEPIVEISTKYFHNLALTKSGKIYQWGASPQNLRYTVQAHRKARHSHGSRTHSHGRAPVTLLKKPPEQEPLQLTDHLLPVMIDTSDIDVDIVQVDCGTNMSVLLTCDGEVYTWGKNFDGQLGIGNRMEQKWPVMVTRINDRKVVHLACGSEFVIAMDTEGIVWAWGRNDVGQLGMNQVETTPSSYAAPYRGQGTKVTDCVLPTRVQALPKPSHVVQAPWTLEEDKRGTVWYTGLGNLKGSENEAPYPTSSVLTLLQHFPHRMELPPLLGLCSDVKAWGVAAQICRDRSLYPQAFYYHLKELSTREQSEKDELQQAAAQATKYYLDKTGGEGNSDVKKAGVESILKELLSFWSEEKLCVSFLENLLQENMANLQVPLFALLARKHTDGEKVNGLNDLPDEFVSKLTSKFQLQLTLSLVQSIESEKLNEDQLKQLVPSSPDSENTRLKAKDKLIPTEKLWQDIFQNLKKDIDTNTCITLSTSQLRTLVEANERRACDSTATNGDDTFKEAADNLVKPSEESSNEAVLFTCGHHYTRDSFLETVIPSFEVNLSQAPNNLPQTASLLSSYYRRKDEQPMACPRCVLSSIQSN